MDRPNLFRPGVFRQQKIPPWKRQHRYSRRVDSIRGDTLMSTSSASLEHEHEHETHGLAPHVRIARAKAIVLMLIVSDALSVLAILAAGGYLSALNTEGQFKIAGDFVPPFVPGLLVMIGLVL